MLQPRCLFLLLLPTIFTCSVNCLSIVRAILPSNVEKGSPLWLNCTHDLAREKLYSIKWYKDSQTGAYQEFYQYIPSNRPPKRQYPLEGIYLDFRKSNFGNVYLRRTDHNSAGNYKCEISSEAPFKTLRDIKQLNIIYNSSNHVYQRTLGLLIGAILRLSICVHRLSL